MRQGQPQRHLAAQISSAQIHVTAAVRPRRFPGRLAKLPGRGKPYAKKIASKGHPDDTPMILRTRVSLVGPCMALLAISTMPARSEAQSTSPRADSAVARNTTHEAAPSLRAARR